MNRLRTTLIVMTAFLWAGCAATPPPMEQKVEQKIVVAEPPAPPAGEKPVPSPRSTEDRELFTEGLALLNQPDRPDQAKARAVFAFLLERYPQSEWRLASETFIRLIDEIAVSREDGRRNRLLAEQFLTERIQSEQMQAERTGAKQENEALQNKLRELTERYQMETAALVQENEKLKRDLQRLKALEIELEKRERMLR